MVSTNSFLVEIRYLPYKQIDKIKWDNCISEAPNGLVYGYAVYLDNMAANWDALILNDYEVVMPLTWKKKYGFYYLYQPYFTACLGIFGKNITAETVEAFLQAVPSKFKYWDFYLNHGNYFQLKQFALYERMNYVLNLQPSYETLYNSFRENVKRNIRKAEKLNCEIKKDIPVTAVLELAKQQFQHFANIEEKDFNHFENLYHHLYKQQQAVTYGAYSNQQLVASCVLFFSHNRLYYIFVGNHPNGKTIGASHALINAFIIDNAGKNLLLDFEGSDIRNLAFFYSSFGASEEKYVGIKLNRLPQIVKLLKK